MKSFFAVVLVSFLAQWVSANDRPNVIIVMTDDQGYGDIECHGNPILKTPNLNQLASESIRFTNFHVSPFCTPTRASLMTGRDAARTGAYRTSSGRTMLHTDERTIANVFADAGYVTGMVGKWHLGDNAPHRPQDRGFQDVVWHRCGGVGQASDHWGNDYFDDTYERNGKFEKFKGYCTDVWFQEASRFIQDNKAKPFLLYLATNAPHGPYRVDPKWSRPYEKSAKWKNGANFYGMIANLDHNLGKLRKHLDKLGLSDNTILIFMTDNGTAAGAKFNGLTSEAIQGYNALMRGKKSSVYEGGHRVPFFIHWPDGKLVGGRDIPSLAAHLDVLPTLAELCGVSVPDSHHADGISFTPQLKSADAKPARENLVVQFYGGPRFTKPPAAWEHTCVVKDSWRLIDGKELYDIGNDPAQREDISSDHPQTVKALRDLYQSHWDSVSPRMTPVSIDVGSPAENPTVLSSQDWYMPKGNPPWNFGAIKKLPRVTGPWNVDVKQSGRYRITLRQYPQAAGKPLVAVRAKIEIAGISMNKDVQAGSKHIAFDVDLTAGATRFKTYLYDQKGRAGGAYFAEVEFIRGDRNEEATAQNAMHQFLVEQLDDLRLSDLPPASRIATYLPISKSLHQLGQPERAKSVQAEAIAIAEQDQARKLDRAIFDHAIETKQFKLADKIAQRPTSKFMKDRLIAARIRAGQREAFNKQNFAVTNFYTADRIAKALVDAGEHELAIDFASGLVFEPKDGNDPKTVLGFVLSQIAHKEMAAGQVDKAKRHIDQAKEVAGGLFYTGYCIEVDHRTIHGNLTNGVNKFAKRGAAYRSHMGDELVANYARALRENGFYDEARQAIQQIVDSENQEHAKTYVAIVQIKKQEFKLAKTSIALIDSPEYRFLAEVHLAVELKKNARTAEAETLVAALEQKWLSEKVAKCDDRFWYLLGATDDIARTKRHLERLGTAVEKSKMIIAVSRGLAMTPIY